MAEELDGEESAAEAGASLINPPSRAMEIWIRSRGPLAEDGAVDVLEVEVDVVTVLPDELPESAEVGGTGVVSTSGSGTGTGGTSGGDGSSPPPPRRCRRRGPYGGSDSLCSRDRPRLTASSAHVRASDDRLFSAREVAVSF